MEQLLPLITNLAVGAVGGNVAGQALKDKSLGFTGNTIAGIVGGLVAGTWLAPIFAAAQSAGLLGDVGTAGIGGAVTMLALSYLKPYLTKAGIEIPQTPSQPQQ